MKKIIGQIIQKLESYFRSQSMKQTEAKMKQANGNTRKLQRFLNERFDFRHNQLTGVRSIVPKTGAPLSAPLMNVK